jgi:phosphomannomutase
VWVNRTDGLRLELVVAWLLVRPSGTEPVIRVMAESTSAADAEIVVGDARARIEELVALAERRGLPGEAS